ncbi:MAG TPA: helicase-related protein, partial [Thermoanaerobaculia bacterium]
YRILVATDIAARGIDVEALSHVVNFDVPNVPDDYIHRVGRTARAEMTGDAVTLVAPEEENDLRAIERAIGKRLPRVTVPDFDYKHRPVERLEIPLNERIAAIRARKKDDRARAAANAARRTAPSQSRGPAPAPSHRSGRPPSGGRPGGGRPGGGRPGGGRPASALPSRGQRRSRGRNRP